MKTHHTLQNISDTNQPLIQCAVWQDTTFYKQKCADAADDLKDQHGGLVSLLLCPAISTENKGVCLVS